MGVARRSGVSWGNSSSNLRYARSSSRTASSSVGKSASARELWSGSEARPRSQPSVAPAMWKTVERMGDQPGTGSAAYCSGVSLRQASSILALAHRLKANSEAKSSRMRILLRLGREHYTHNAADDDFVSYPSERGAYAPRD